jgi:hypothetical protein
MPDQLFTYNIVNHLDIISINSGSWGTNGYLARDSYFGNGKGGIKGGVGMEDGGFPWVEGPGCHSNQF